nr:MAG TPA: hypothetical protein [Caudoviricetes sp.]
MRYPHTYRRVHQSPRYHRYYEAPCMTRVCESRRLSA